MIHYVVLTTGSCGNCYCFYDGDTAILVDCGVTYTKLSTELDKHDIPLSSIKAVFLTHLHPDHAKGVGAVQRKLSVPVYVSSRCYHNGKTEMMKQKLEVRSVVPVDWGVRTRVGFFTVTLYQTSHDSPGSSGCFIENGNDSIFLMTDTGVIPDEAYSYALPSSVKFIEANYDDDMLTSGPYPEWLKARVRGVYGHLSNSDAVTFASRVSRRGDQVYFIHVSENNNDITLLRNLAFSSIESGIFVKCCERGEMFEGFTD